MLHSDTELVIKKPILVISGANGSGKTQILEALMILLGEKSPRSKKGLQSIINDKDLESEIDIEVNNIRPNGSFVFQQLETSVKFFFTLVPSGTSRSASSEYPIIAERILLKSCATPPASVPIASIFCAC